MAAVKKTTATSAASPGGKGAAGWIILGMVLVLGFNFALRWRLAEMPLERDEGEYAYAGQLIRQGIPPYQLAYNMKFPGVYFAYAGLMTLCGETTRGIHLGMALVTSLTAVLVFLIGRKLFSPMGGLLAAASYVLLAAAPAAFGLAGHATHFIALFTTAGALILLGAEEKPAAWKWSLAGVLFGSAILMKQHALLSAALMVGWIGWSQWKKNPAEKLSAAKPVALFIGGSALPLLVMAVGLASAGVWKQFYFWAIEYATQYASAVSIRTAWSGFLNGFTPVFNTSWSLWVTGLLGVGAIFYAQQFRRQGVILILFLGGMLAAIPGFHFRGHYFLAALPGLALLSAAAGMVAWGRIKDATGRGLLAAIIGAALLVPMWNNRAIWFTASPAQVARQVYSLNPFLESPVVADYLREHTAPEDKIAVIGSEPQIYFHARRHSASGYLYMYALTEPQPLGSRMREEFAREVETNQPRYIVFVDIVTSWISLTQSDTSILTWWNEFVKQHYEIVGAVRLTADQPTEYYWDEAVVRTLDLAECHLLIYRRK
jgi:hypothetical protein